MTLGEAIHRHLAPADPRWGSYANAWNEADFALYFRNSVLLTAIVIVGVLVTCTLAGYAFAKIRFPGREITFMALLATLMIPGTVTFIPNFLMLRGTIVPWGSWLNTLPASTMPFMATAFIIFLFRQFFLAIPDERWDAARLDGAGHLRFRLAVVLPMSKPVLAAAALPTYVTSWNEFLWPLLVTTTPTWRPLGVGPSSFITEAGPSTHLLTAGSVITIVPVLIGLSSPRSSSRRGSPPRGRRAYEKVDPSGQSLVFWHQLSGDARAALEDIVAAFNETNHRGITVTAEYQGNYGDIVKEMPPVPGTADTPTSWWRTRSRPPPANWSTASSTWTPSSTPLPGG